MKEVVSEKTKDRERYKPIYLEYRDELRKLLEKEFVDVIKTTSKKYWLFGKPVTREFKHVKKIANVRDYEGHPSLCKNYALLIIEYYRDNGQKDLAHLYLKDGVIEVFDKDLYEMLHKFGNKHNFHEIKRSWEEEIA